MFCKVSKTPSIDGRFLGSASKHFIISSPASNAPFIGYCSSSLGSIIFLSLLLSVSDGLVKSTKTCSPEGRFVSSARNPVSISSSTTPNPYTSLFTYKWPVNFNISIFIFQLIMKQRRRIIIIMGKICLKQRDFTGCNIFRSCVAESPHNARCYMWISINRSKFRQPKIRKFGIVRLQKWNLVRM